jgi:2-polyprenyl-3-methyl-5-hydroxy-6-metoxy-1,4-benzoquinol methylase
MKVYCSCPACRSTNTVAKLKISSRQAAQHFVQAQEYPDLNLKLRTHIEKLWGGETCQIHTCDRCSFGFAWPFVAGDAMFYKLAYPHVAYPGAKGEFKWAFKRTLAALAGRDLSRMSALEVGAGLGFFLDALCEQGASAALLQATENNGLAVERLRDRGYSVTRSDVRSHAFDAMISEFDYIFLFQVIEQMDSLDVLFERLGMLAKPDGSIFITVPNTAHIDYQETSGSLIDMPPHHIGRWTVRALESIASRHGFDIAEHETQPFDPLLFLRTDLVASHVRRSQNRPDSVSGMVRSMPRGRMRTALEMVAMAAGAVGRFPHWVAAYPDRSELGLTLWMHLRRR